MDKYILAIDEGTTSCRALLYNKQGEVVARCEKDLGISVDGKVL